MALRHTMNPKDRYQASATRKSKPSGQMARAAELLLALASSAASELVRNLPDTASLAMATAAHVADSTRAATDAATDDALFCEGEPLDAMLRACPTRARARVVTASIRGRSRWRWREPRRGRARRHARRRAAGGVAAPLSRADAAAIGFASFDRPVFTLTGGAAAARSRPSAARTPPRARRRRRPAGGVRAHISGGGERGRRHRRFRHQAHRRRDRPHRAAAA